MTRWRLLAWTGLGVYWLTLVSLTHLPGRMIPLTGVSDKMLHFLAYWGLALFVYTALWSTFPRRRIALPAIVIVLLHGALDEWTQGMVGRSAEFADWIADLLGATAGAGFMLLVRRLALGSRIRPLPPPGEPGPMYEVPPWSHRGR